MQTRRNKHLDTEQIAICAEALSNETYNELHKELRLHLRDCHSCAEEVINVSDVYSETKDITIPDDLFRDVKKEEKSGRVLPLRKSFFIAIPAAAAVLVAVVLLNSLWFANLNKQEISEMQDVVQDEKTITPELAQLEDTKTTEDITTVKKELEESIETEELAIDAHLIAKFEPNPSLEQLYANIQGSYRGQTIEVVSPSEVYYSEGLNLKWKNPDNKTLYLEIFNNKGEEIHLEATKKEAVELPLLEPGLYYWKLISEDFDLYFVGKIISK